MTPTDFERLREGDQVLVTCKVTGFAIANQFHKDEPLHVEGVLVMPVSGGMEFPAIASEIAGYAAHPDHDFIVGDRVTWDEHSTGWFIVHIIPETRDAVILHELAGLGARRTALSRLTRVKA